MSFRSLLVPRSSFWIAATQTSAYIHAYLASTTLLLSSSPVARSHATRASATNIESPWLRRELSSPRTAAWTSRKLVARRLTDHAPPAHRDKRAFHTDRLVDTDPAANRGRYHGPKSEKNGSATKNRASLGLELRSPPLDHASQQRRFDARQLRGGAVGPALDQCGAAFGSAALDKVDPAVNRPHRGDTEGPERLHLGADPHEWQD